MLPNERVAVLEEMLVRAEAISTELDNRLADVETVALEAQTAIADVNLPAEQKAEMLKIVDESLAQIKKISAIRGEYTAKITNLRAKIEVAKVDGVSFGEELQLYAEGLQSVAGKIPGVGSYVTIGSMILAVIGGVIARRRSQQRDIVVAERDEVIGQRNEAENAVEGVVRSVDRLLASDAVKDPKAAKQVLKDAQDSDVRIVVDTIRG